MAQASVAWLIAVRTWMSSTGLLTTDEARVLRGGPTKQVYTCPGTLCRLLNANHFVF